MKQTNILAIAFFSVLTLSGNIYGQLSKSKPGFAYSPREKTGMSYIECTATRILSNQDIFLQKAACLKARISSFRWFNISVAGTDEQINFTASRQGKVTGIEATGAMAAWLAPDISLLVALLPVDGLRPGDSWEGEEYLRIPAFQGTEIPPVRPKEMRITNVHDEYINGIKCRLLRSAAEV